VRNIVPNVTIRIGHWEARCQCGVEYIDEPVADRAPLDPLDPKTSCHVP
jgi:hypothetical protein